MWEQYDPATDSILCLKPDQAQKYPLGTLVFFSGVEFRAVKHEAIRDAVSQQVAGYFIYFKPVGREDVQSDS
jgi:hypothetical protein